MCHVEVMLSSYKITLDNCVSVGPPGGDVSCRGYVV